MKIILVGKVHECMVDDQDFDALSVFRWFLTDFGHAKRNCYTRENGVQRNRVLKMHRVIMQAPPRQIVDHIDGNPLNNQRSNLRFVTATQNSMNKKVRRDCQTGYCGISRDRKWWRARISVNGNDMLLGRFHSMEEAIRVRAEAEALYFGEYSRNAPGKTLSVPQAKMLNLKAIRP